MTTLSNDALRQLMGEATARLEQTGVAVGSRVDTMPDVVDVRRRRLGPSSANVARAGYLTLVRGADGLLDWQVDGGPAPFPSRRAARRGVFDAQPIDQVAFKPVQGSQVAAFLASLDRGFNPRYGLFDLDGRRVDRVADRGRVLLLVHGTFSRCDSIVGQLQAQPDGSGAALLAAARTAYTQVLLFEHPTLAVGPVLNALDLSRAFAGSTAQVDVIGHSRGGLVARWWLEAFSRALAPTARVVFVGSPLMGTGLASPHRLRGALKLLTNYAAAVQQASGLASLAVPMFSVVEGLVGLLASSTSALARAPVVDGAVAMVPGLAAMSRFGPDGSEFVAGNFELEKLAFGWTAPPAGYFTVGSNFESDDPGWRFWQAFRQLRLRAADAAGELIFSGENDLVVDTDSMSRLAAGVRIADPSRRLDFGTSTVVHHLNYFAQAKTAAFIRTVLGF